VPDRKKAEIPDLLESFSDHVHWDGVDRSLKEHLSHLASSDSRPSIEALAQLKPQVIAKINDRRGDLYVKPDAGPLADMETALRQLDTEVSLSVAEANFQTELASSLRFGAAKQCMTEFTDSVARLSSGSYDDDLSRRVLTIWNERWPTVRSQLSRLVSAVLARLGAEPVDAYVIDRLQTWLELFAKDGILEEIDRLGSDTRKRKNQPGVAAEVNVLQREVRRFTYAEGLWPITELQAGSGRLDVLVEGHVTSDLEGELHTAANQGHRPALIEIKQVIRRGDPAGSRKAALRTAVKGARNQLRTYGDWLRASRHWRDHRAYALVIYDGRPRYRLKDAADVRLVYLGPDRPSDIVVELEV
jgi:hypothetical protein